MKTKGVFAGTATRKLTNTPAVIFSYPCGGRWFIFAKQIIIVLFWVIFYSYLQKFFKIGVLLKTFRNSQETPVSVFHFNQPVACYFFNKRLRHRCFLVNFAKLSRTPFSQTTLGLLLLYSFGHVCNITKFSVFTKVTFPIIWDARKYWNVYMWNENYVNLRIYSLSLLLIL